MAMPALFLAAMLSACTGPSECDASRPCAGFGETCISGECVAGNCATSAQCPMEHHCDARVCEPGCTTPNDCYPGSTCNLELGVCEEELCFDTNIDCGYREFCNQATGDCYDAGDNYCKFCDEDAECGSGNLCIAHYCGVDCSGGKDCPSGFDCYPFNDEFGNIAAYQCFTYCWLYEDYEPGDFSTKPMPGPPEVIVDADRARAAGASASP